MAREVQIRFKGIDSTGRAVRGVVTGLKSVQKHTHATQALQRSWNKGLNANRRMVQQLGFQLTDFATQVAGGQSAMLAFTQQGGQMLQFFGPFGAMAAAALAVFGSLAIAVTRSGQSFNVLAPSVALLSDDIQKLVAGLRWLRELAIDIANVAINNLTAMFGAAGAALAFFTLKAITASGVMMTLKTMTLGVSFMFAKYTTSAAIAGSATLVFKTGVVLLSRALVVLKGIFLTFLPIAVILGIGLVVQAFFQVRKGAGSTGAALELLGDVAAAAFEYMVASASYIPAGLATVWNTISLGFLRMVRDIKTVWANFLHGMADSLRDVKGMEDALLMVHGAAVKAGSSVHETTMAMNGLESESAKAMAIAEIKTLGAAAKLKAANAKLIDAWKDGKSDIDLRSAFSGGGVPGTKGGGGGATSQATKDAEKIKSIFDDMQKSISNSMMSSFKSLLKGTKSLGDAVADILSNILDNVINLLMQPIFNNLAGGIASGLMGGPSVNSGGGLLGALAGSFDGGGFTGTGARAGGVDGKGGRYAIVHPNETVVDHEKGQSVGGSNVYMNITTPDAPSFKRSQRQLVQRGRRAMGV